jgi:hypothetical protein
MEPIVPEKDPKVHKKSALDQHIQKETGSGDKLTM